MIEVISIIFLLSVLYDFNILVSFTHAFSDINYQFHLLCVLVFEYYAVLAMLPVHLSTETHYKR